MLLLTLLSNLVSLRSINDLRITRKPMEEGEYLEGEATVAAARVMEVEGGCGATATTMISMVHPSNRTTRSRSSLPLMHTCSHTLPSHSCRLLRLSITL